MGLTVSQVIERAQEEILNAGGTARPGWDVQEGSITDSGTSLVLEGRHSNTPADSIVEWEDTSMEVAEVKSVSGTTVTLQSRGYLGTTAASHTDNTKVIIDPPYPRYVLLNGLKAVIGQLYGFGLYQMALSTSLTYSSVAPVSLPTGTKDVAEVIYQNGSNWFPLPKGQGWRIFNNYGGLNTPAIQFLGGGPAQGAALKVSYKKDFDTSTFALTTDLETTVGLPSTLTPHLALGLAGHILMGRDVPQLESEYIPPDPRDPQLGSRLNVGRSLWTSFISGPVAAERVRNLETNPTTIVFERLG